RDLMRLEIRGLRGAEVVVPSLVVVDAVEGGGNLGGPELEVGDVAGELLAVEGGECDELGGEEGGEVE
ncbi:MAG: hypothetical protein K2Q20_13575, partial [Phycisphaerales bacterium]|nr:hypothetical protein [Phycisphaerales bacterium]